MGSFKHFLRYCFSVLTIFLLFSGCGSDKVYKHTPVPKAGLLNLQNWDFSKNGLIELTGEWEFYWEKLLLPEDFFKKKLPAMDNLVHLPNVWNGYVVAGKELSGKGYATYRLKVILRNSDEELGLKFNTAGTATAIYINGKLSGTTGVVGKNKETSAPGYFPYITIFKPSSNVLEIILHVSNFYHSKGGPWDAILFGSGKDIEKKRERRIALELFLFGSLFIMAIYHIGLYTLRNKDKSALYFGLFCFLVALRTLVTGEYYLLNFFPGLGWEFLHRIEYLTFYISVPVFVMFIQYLFPKEFNRYLLWIFEASGIFFYGIVLLTKAAFYTYTTQIFQVITLFGGCYVIFVLIISSIRKREGASVFLLGFLVLFVALVNDILHYNQIITTAEFTPLGLFIFIFSQAFIISKRFSQAFYSIEKLEVKYRQIFENAVEGIFQASIDYKIMNANPAMAKIFGYDSSQELLSSDINFVQICFTDQKDAEKFYATLKEKGKISGLDGQGIRRDGSSFYGTVSVRSIFNNHGEILYYEGSVVDITERKEKEKAEKEQEAALAATKAKSEFLANMSHEIRTPMNAIMGFAELALKTNLSIKQRDYISKINRAGKSLLGIINDILDFSKIEAGKLDLENVYFQLNDIVENLSDIFSKNISEKNIEIIISVSEDVPVALKGDGLRLGQILINLVSNAVKFTENGEVIIKIKVADKNPEWVRLLFSVKDTGIGLSKEQSEKLFSPFIQADGSTTRKYGGTGLGLAICKRITEMMDGEIWLESEPGKGSIFSFTAKFGYKDEDISVKNWTSFPDLSHYQTSNVESKQLHEIKNVMGKIAHLNLLLVEDNSINQQVAQEILNSADINVTIADNGEDAVKAIINNKFDIVLMDIQMPVMDGYEATRKIRELEAQSLNRLPVIAMTAHAMHGDKEKCLEAGMDDYVTKPIESEKLFLTIAKFCPDKTISNSMEKIKKNDLEIVSDFPGIDLKSSIRRLGGNKNLFKKLLSEFYTDYSNVTEKIKSSLKIGETATAQRLIHTLKGLAGTFSANLLYKDAVELELKLKKGYYEGFDRIVDSFQKNLDQVMESSKKWLLSQKEEPKETKDIIIKDVNKASLIMKLMKLLTDNDLEAEELLEDLKFCLNDSSFEQEIAQIEEYIAKLNFVEAKDVLSKIACKYSDKSGIILEEKLDGL